MHDFFGRCVLFGDCFWSFSYSVRFEVLIATVKLSSKGSGFFNITKCVTFEHNHSLLLVSIVLRVSFLFMDHHQAYIYISKT
jgi:hypothetical protein